MSVDAVPARDEAAMTADFTEPQTTKASPTHSDNRASDAHRSSPHAEPSLAESTIETWQADTYDWSELAGHWAEWKGAPVMLAVRQVPRWQFEKIQEYIVRVLAAEGPDDLTVTDTVSNYAPRSSRAAPVHRAADPDPARVEELVAAVVNILSDTYLDAHDQVQAMIKRNPEGYLHLDAIMKLEPIRQLRTTRLELESALRHYRPVELELSADRQQIRRRRSKQTDKSGSTDTVATGQSAVPSQSDAVPLTTVPEPVPEAVDGYFIFADSSFHLDYTQCSFDGQLAQQGPYQGRYQMDVQAVLGDPADPDCEHGAPDRICFNCRSTLHRFKDCPEPRNQAAIERNRAQFKVEQKPSFGGRFHAEMDTEAKRLETINHLKPGQYSDELLKALGVRVPAEGESAADTSAGAADQGDTNSSCALARLAFDDNTTPEFVLRMAKFGYPPGYIGTEPDADPLQVARDFEPAFTPLVIYAYGSDIADEVKTEVDSGQQRSAEPSENTKASLTTPEAPTTPTAAGVRYYPLVRYPGLNLDQFRFEPPAPGHPKNPPAMWRATPLRPSSHRDHDRRERGARYDRRRYGSGHRDDSLDYGRQRDDDHHHSRRDRYTDRDEYDGRDHYGSRWGRSHRSRDRDHAYSGDEFASLMDSYLDRRGDSRRSRDRSPEGRSRRLDDRPSHHRSSRHHPYDAPRRSDRESDRRSERSRPAHTRFVSSTRSRSPRISKSSASPPASVGKVAAGGASDATPATSVTTAFTTSDAVSKPVPAATSTAVLAIDEDLEEGECDMDLGD
ncbi:Zinc finger CCHC domain-containing protein 8 [Tieghemiomyces parasiticus]|uniref:Zinc finger CCHC domain-containing protein 8 n=1 Tax=Tieghemiomyces parasiticus TaxID=78921 RepID=A0A9W8AFV9_9FUNG|nr:Zinc finger CCHC domain-containing protein 8 [Tieghemiomyces parasiticus]